MIEFDKDVGASWLAPLTYLLSWRNSNGWEDGKRNYMDAKQALICLEFYVFYVAWFLVWFTHREASKKQHWIHKITETGRLHSFAQKFIELKTKKKGPTCLGYN